ncbi:MAG: polysaccharide biosynthesis tyrosine autokinase [Candidatus Omnitrophica bacterium]|nr:polysaccharide biosynthesis tyrosine autokinase [Candidatus Omnitrophota bacterium]
MNNGNGSGTVPDDFLMEKNEPSELVEYWHVLLGHRWIILGITAAAAVCSLIYLSLLPNLYTGETQILVERVNKAPKSYEEMMIPLSGGDEDYYGTQIAVLTGRKIGQMARSELGLDGVDYKVDARRIRGTRILTVAVKHRHPETAAKIANKYAEVFMRETMRDSFYMAQQMLKWIPEGGDAAKGSPSAPEVTQTDIAESLDYVANDPVIQSLKNEKLAIESQVREMSQRYKSQHPVVKESHERLRRVESEIHEQTAKLVDKLKANVSGQYQITNIKILQEAVPPATPSEPNRVKGFFLSLFLGLGLGVFAVLFVEYANQKVRSEEDLSPSIRLPFLGYVPFVKELVKKKRGKGKKVHLDERSPGFSVVQILKGNSTLSDAITNVRTRVLFSMPYERSKKILVTSAVPDEGKSTVALLLAMSLGSMGERVLLVDADMRRPFLHQYLRVQNVKGLTDFLIGSASLEETIISVGGLPLHAVTAGTRSANPVELLESKRFEEFLNQVSPQFDRIIIDVAPVLFIPDGLIIAKHVDQAVLICGSGMVHKKIVKMVKDRLEAVGRPFLGVVINRADFEYGAYSYRYKYYRYYKSYKNYYKKEEAAVV